MIDGLKVFAKEASCNTMRILLAEDGPLKSSPAVADWVVYTVGGGRVYAFADSDIMED